MRSLAVFTPSIWMVQLIQVVGERTHLPPLSIEIERVARVHDGELQRFQGVAMASGDRFLIMMPPDRP